MKHALPLLLLFPALLSAKPAPRPEVLALDKAVEQAGGYSKYQRLETMTWDFEAYTYDPAVSTSPLVERGSRALRVHDAQGLRVWERGEGGRVTVLLSSSPRNASEEALLRDTACLFLPHWIKESGRPIKPLPDGFLQNRLMGRLGVEGEPLFPGAENMLLFLHKGTGHVEGAAFGTPEASVTFHAPVATKGWLVVPGGMVFYDAAGARKRAVKTTNVVVNGYVEESLFTQGATP